MLQSLNAASDLPGAQRSSLSLSLNNTVPGESCSKVGARRWSHTQPENTMIYKVKCTDNLTSIAACYDTTPSVLKKLNKLTADFLYTDQMLYVPITKDEGISNTPSEFTSSVSDVQTESDLYSGSSYEDDLCNSASVESSHSRSYQQDSMKSATTPDVDVSEHVQSYGKVESPQAFISLLSRYIIPHQKDGVTGTLLVTPNAVMFNPYVCDPLVVESGVEEYGVVAKMDTIISAAIYRDCPAVQDSPSEASIKKPQIYHVKDCQLRRDVQVDSPIITTDMLDGRRLMRSTPSCSCMENTLTSLGNGLAETTLTDEDQSESAATQNETTTEQTETTLVQSETTSNPDSTNNASSDVNEEQTATSNPITFTAGCDSDDLGISESVESKLSCTLTLRLHRRTPSAASSSYSVGVTSNTELFVDYSSGMFEDIECDGAAATTSACDDDMVGNVRLKAGMCLKDTPHLFQPISSLLTQAQKSTEISTAPFYLCLQVGERVASTCPLPDTCPIEAYKKQRRPEYWFTVPSDQVDSLYNFFIRWRPELYGEEITDEAILSSRGFISIPEKGARSADASNLPCSPMVRQLSHSKVVKDWEIFSLNEVVRIKSLLDVQKYLPFPDMEQGSLLLTEQDINQLVMCLPARVEGHKWRLAYSNEDHGFSLSTLYRNTSELDSATILVIQDENNGLFGAFSSTSIHMCEHFYGNGECFLFSYVDGFKHYNWTSKNLYCVQGDLQGITIGTGSATCGLWIDSGLYHGRTQHCDTFDNEPLTGGDEDFIVKAIEVWSLSECMY